MKDFERFMHLIVRKAGVIALANFQLEQKIGWKKGKSIVTATDIKINKFLVSEIKKNFSGHNIISEELPDIKNKHTYTWFIDPIDGTINYAQGIPYFGVSVGLARGKEIIMGMVFDPVHKELFFAEKGRGSFLNGRKFVSTARNNFSESMISVEIWNNSKYPILKMKQALEKRIWVLSERQCLCVSACYSALGRMDGYIFSHDTPWDVAAIDLICREAGLKTSQMDGQPWYPGGKMKGYVCARPKVHKELIGLLKPYIKKI
ncbi:MAG: inositol monophosphatase [Patescibacteria group bacterium]